MAIIESVAKIDFTIVLTLNDAEIRALDAFVGYGDDAFIAKFKESLGAAYISKHEKGLRELFISIREIIPGQLARLDAAKKAFGGFL